MKRLIQIIILALTIFVFSCEKESKDFTETIKIVTGKNEYVVNNKINLTSEYAQTQRLINAFLGHSYDEKPELYSEASPITYLNSSCPPTLILHGTSDTLVPVSQSDTLKSRLDVLGVPCEYYRVPLWPHSMDMAKRVNDFSQKKMEAFFERYL